MTARRADNPRMKRRGGVLTAALCLSASGCGSGDYSERRAASLEAAPFVSSDFGVDSAPMRRPDASARLLDVAGSASRGYLLSYEVPDAPEYWSRRGLLGHLDTPYSIDQLVLVNWSASTGEPS